MIRAGYGPPVCAVLLSHGADKLAAVASNAQDIRTDDGGSARMEELMNGDNIKRVRRARMRKNMPQSTKKVADVLEDAFKMVGDKGSMTLPVETVLAMGLPATCKGGKITNDEVLDAEEGTRHCEFERDGISYSFAYNEGPDPFGPQKMIDITVEGVFH